MPRGRRSPTFEVRLVTSLDGESWDCPPGRCGVCCRTGPHQEWCQHYDTSMGGCVRYANRPPLCHLFPFVLTFDRAATYLSPSFACPHLQPRGAGEPLSLSSLLSVYAVERLLTGWAPFIDSLVERYSWRRQATAGGARVAQPTADDVERLVRDEAAAYIDALPGGYPELLHRCAAVYARLAPTQRADLLPWDLRTAARDALAPSFTYISSWGLPGGPDGPVHITVSMSDDGIACESFGYRITLPVADLTLPFEIEEDARAMYARYIDLLLRRHAQVTMAARSLAPLGGVIPLPLPTLYLKNLLILVRYTHVFLLLWGQLSGGRVDGTAMREVLSMADTFAAIAVGFRGVPQA